MATPEMQRLIDGHSKRSHYERTHWVHCYESNEDVRSVIYDPNGNTMTFGELCALINELQDENEELRAKIENNKCPECHGFGSPPGEAAGLICGACFGTGIKTALEID